MSWHTEPLPAARWVRAGGEGLLVGLATLSAWPFASVQPHFEYLLTAGVALLALLWAVHAALTRRFSFRPDFVTVALAGLILLAVAQLVPLPVGVVKVLSPARAEWHETFLPDQFERLPGEADTPRPAFVPLSVNPHATRTHAAQLLAVFAVYAAARHWLADRDSLRRFAWAATVNGVLLALLALGQFFSSPKGVAFWTFDVGGAVFGPFVCRNHYPDYQAFGIGGAIYLLLPPRQERTRTAESWRARLVGLLDIFDRPASLFAALALGLMLASVPFSQSRGGVAAVAAGGVGLAVLAGWGRKGIGPVGVVAAVGVGLVLWLGIGPITERFRDDGHTLDDRLPLWYSAVKPLPQLWAVGSGGGTFVNVEPLGRTTQPASVVFEHAHNEYLEAAVEGGVVRLGLTLVLAVGVPLALGRAYRRLRGRSAGAFALGVWFAVLVLAVHSAIDFAIHLPAVAVMAAAAVGMAMGESEALTPRPPLPPHGEGVFTTKTGSVNTPAEQATKGDAPKPSQVDPPLSRPRERGPGGEGFSFLFPLLLTLAVGMCALDARARWRADGLRIAAEAAPDTTTGIDLQARRTRVAPTDPAAWYDLAQAHLRAFAEVPSATERHLIPALAALRTARELCPLHPDTHVRLGLNAQRFEKAEPAVVHLRRATRVLPTDPDVWFLLGAKELEAGDRAAAEASWRRSLELSPRRLRPILQASASLPAEALRDRVLSDDPAVLMQAAEVRPAGERRVFVDAAARAVSRDGLTAAQAAAAAMACDELERFDDPAAMWQRTTTARPTDRELREAAARWFEQQERYADAVPHLEWLTKQSPADIGLRDRLAAARHGAELKRLIGR